MTLEAIRYRRGSLSILDQLLLPLESKYVQINSVRDGWDAIRQMKVRGAPAIAIVGCLSLAIDLKSKTFVSKKELYDTLCENLEFLVTARPTAVNIKQAAELLEAISKRLVEDSNISVDEMKEMIITASEDMLALDVGTNKAIGEHGAKHILSNTLDKEIRILTHCNTGSLATAGYGTALGIIRSLHSMKRLTHVYCTETRPYNQGSRLTAYELVHEKIPATLICDSMVAALFKTQKISAVVVGADRVVANGDTANKIGTYQLAVLAKFHEVPFYVAAPTTSIDLSMQDGSAIPIEERSPDEVTTIQGFQIAAPGIGCWNPAFDVTPAALITGGIVTENGVIPPEKVREIRNFQKIP